MSEFNNRMDLQRKVLRIINKVNQEEELCGLSLPAIERWRKANKVDDDSEVLRYLLRLADDMSLLANKSQEQITEDYEEMRSRVKRDADKLKDKINEFRNRRI